MPQLALAKLARYWHTLRHLRAVQIYGRLWFRLHRPGIDARPAPARRMTQNRDKWILPARRKPSLLGADRFCFLNEIRDLATHGWDDPRLEKLWRYNLHYCDDLNAQDAAMRKAWHEALLPRWAKENPPGIGTGWEPYPTSLRIINWIKWELAGNTLTPECVDSLASQTRWLMQRLEIHLLGNHLLSNAKALVFAGLFFDGTEAQNWLQKGLQILSKEIPEQILSDGGQFERSPMYHALALEDLLDLYNFFGVFADALPPTAHAVAATLPVRITSMQHFLESMLHPDGEIGFFNDAAFGIAPHPSELARYARELGLTAPSTTRSEVTHLEASGYLRIERGLPTQKGVSERELARPAALVALLDVAPVGPDYLPGHAHADTLSFELSLFGERVLVNSGTSCYVTSAQRERERSTSAHNTVVIDDRNSSEVWASFRVARRAYPRKLEIQRGEPLVIRCAHDGYRHLPGHPEHRRQWTFEGNTLLVEDRVHGMHHRAVARFYLHPNVTIEPTQDFFSGRALLTNGHTLRWEVEAGQLSIEASTYHPEFGKSIPNRCLALRLVYGYSRILFAWS